MKVVSVMDQVCSLVIQCTAYVLPLGGHLLGYYRYLRMRSALELQGVIYFVVGGSVPLGDEVGELEDVLTNFLCVVICTGLSVLLD